MEESHLAYIQQHEAIHKSFILRPTKGEQTYKNSPLQDLQTY